MKKDFSGLLLNLISYIIALNVDKDFNWNYINIPVND
jgi:hypothetical protein